MPRSRVEKIFKENFTLFTPKLHTLELWVIKVLISSLLTLQILHTKMVKIGQVVLEKKTLTDHARRRTPTHSKRQPIAIGHLSDSVDLKLRIFHLFASSHQMEPITGDFWLLKQNMILVEKERKVRTLIVKFDLTHLDNSFCQWILYWVWYH